MKLKCSNCRNTIPQEMSHSSWLSDPLRLTSHNQSFCKVWNNQQNLLSFSQKYPAFRKIEKTLDSMPTYKEEKYYFNSPQ